MPEGVLPPAVPAGRPPALQALPARQAQLVLKLCAWLAGRGFGSQDRSSFLLAVSGGADSCALACLMAYAAPRLGLRLCALALDHGLRPESALEAAYASDLCGWLGIPCQVERIGVQEHARYTGQGTEDAARTLRYQALERRRLASGAQWTATAHHKRDLAEDMLMRLVRGTGWPGLGGMPAMDVRRRLVRPLLHEDPLALRAFLATLGVQHCEDPSNCDPAYTRNRVRHSLLPLLRRENPKVEDAMLGLARMATADADFFGRELDAALARTPWRMSAEGLDLPKALLQGLPKALRLRLYLRALQASGTAGQARSGTLFLLDEAWEAGGRPRTFELPGGTRIRLRRGALRIEPAGIHRQPGKTEQPALSPCGKPCYTKTGVQDGPGVHPDNFSPPQGATPCSAHPAAPNFPTERPTVPRADAIPPTTSRSSPAPSAGSPSKRR